MCTFVRAENMVRAHLTEGRFLEQSGSASSAQSNPLDELLVSAHNDSTTALSSVGVDLMSKLDQMMSLGVLTNEEYCSRRLQIEQEHTVSLCVRMCVCVNVTQLMQLFVCCPTDQRFSVFTSTG